MKDREESRRGGEQHLRFFAECKCAEREGKEAANHASVQWRGGAREQRRGEGESDGSSQSRRGREGV